MTDDITASDNEPSRTLLPAFEYKPDMFTPNSKATGFLSAVARHASENYITGFGKDNHDAELFHEQVTSYNPDLKVQWLGHQNWRGLGKIGTLHLTNSNISFPSKIRLRAHPLKFSIIGMVEAIADARSAQKITDMLKAPLMPWDALICPSRTVGEAIKTILASEQAYLSWRFGVKNLQNLGPQIPIIPNGIDCSAYHYDDTHRSFSRRHFQADEHTIVILFKAGNDYNFCQALKTILDGHPEINIKILYLTDSIDTPPKLFQEIIPTIPLYLIDESDPSQESWGLGAADLFICLTGSIAAGFDSSLQKAMAAGVAVVTSDWDGHRALNMHGTTGYRIACYIAKSGSGNQIRNRYALELDNFDQYITLTESMIALDHNRLVYYLKTLLTNQEQRLHFGGQARKHISAHFDWSVVYKDYHLLWTELQRIRRHAMSDETLVEATRQAPLESADMIEPCRLFSSFATFPIDQNTPVIWRFKAENETALKQEYRKLTHLPTFSMMRELFPTMDEITQIYQAFNTANHPFKAEDLSQTFDLTEVRSVQILTLLLKFDWIALALTPDLIDRYATVSSFTNFSERETDQQTNQKTVLYSTDQEETFTLSQPKDT